MEVDTRPVIECKVGSRLHANCSKEELSAAALARAAVTFAPKALLLSPPTSANQTTCEPPAGIAKGTNPMTCPVSLGARGKGFTMPLLKKPEYPARGGGSGGPILGRGPNVA